MQRPFLTRTLQENILLARPLLPRHSRCLRDGEGRRRGVYAGHPHVVHKNVEELTKIDRRRRKNNQFKKKKIKNFLVSTSSSSRGIHIVVAHKDDPYSVQCISSIEHCFFFFYSSYILILFLFIIIVNKKYVLYVLIMSSHIIHIL